MVVVFGLSSTSVWKHAWLVLQFEAKEWPPDPRGASSVSKCTIKSNYSYSVSVLSVVGLPLTQHPFTNSFLPYVFKNMVTSNTSIRSHSKLHNGGQECSDKMSGRFYRNNFCASTCYLWGNFLVQAYFICHTKFEVCEKYQMNSVLGRDWSMVVCCYLYICFYVRFIFFVSNNTFFSYPSLTQWLSESTTRSPYNNYHHTLCGW